MPRKKWINRNNPSTQTYQLLYRSQDDPLLHEENADERALFPVGNANNIKNQYQSQYGSSLNGFSTPSALSSSQSQSAFTSGLHLTDLERSRDVDLDSMRENEGEAAQYGIYYDDSKYDYMQHLRELGGEDGGDAVTGHFVEAALQNGNKGKGKDKVKGMKLEDALRQVRLDDDLGDYESISSHQMMNRPDSVFEDDLSTFSRSERQRTYQDQQDVPDEIAGFQPDMDPRLREVLEALDDDAYVDGDDEDDIFGALGKAGKVDGEIDLAEFEANYDEFDGDEDGWESDVTEKATQQSREFKVVASRARDTSLDIDGLEGQGLSESLSEDMTATAVAEDGDWLRNFAKYKRDAATVKKSPIQPDGSVVAASAVDDRAPTLYTLNGTPLRQKKRKGALTNPSAYSMTSSSLARTDGQQLLDARFDQVEKMYALDEMDEFDDADGGVSMISGLTGKSKMSSLSTTSFADEGAVRSDFDGMVDDFLGDWNKANPGGKRKGAKGKRGKNGNEKHGLAQLDEIRGKLGRGRILHKPQKA